MTGRTVHIDGTGELRSMQLDAWQVRGERCAVCNRTDVATLHRFGEVVNGEPVVVCDRCRKKV